MKRMLNNKNIIRLILLNFIIIFLLGYFPDNKILIISDLIITTVFIIEIIFNIKNNGIKYFKDGRNIFDTILVLLSVPSLIFINNDSYDISFILMFRVFRVFKVIKTIKYIDGLDHLIKGLKKALKSSLFIIVCFLIFIFIVGMISNTIFNESDMFNNPHKSFYSIFQILTLEGWQDIINGLVEQKIYNNIFVYSYFISIVFMGGIFGISFINSIVVDAMVSDNNDELIEEIKKLHKKIDDLKK